jgi:hypothetical protein
MPDNTAGPKPLFTPSRRLNTVATAICGFWVMVYGIFLLVGFLAPDLGWDMKALWLPLMFLAFWLIFLTPGVLRRDSGCCWVSGVFLTLFIVFVCTRCFDVPWSIIWPTFLLMPAISAVSSMWLSKNLRGAVKTIVLFVPLAFFWYLFSVGLIKQWWICLIIALIALGAFSMINALTSRKGSWDDGDRLQRKQGEWEKEYQAQKEVATTAQEKKDDEK